MHEVLPLHTNGMHRLHVIQLLTNKIEPDGLQYDLKVDDIISRRFDEPQSCSCPARTATGCCLHCSWGEGPTCSIKSWGHKLNGPEFLCNAVGLPLNEWVVVHSKVPMSTYVQLTAGMALCWGICPEIKRVEADWTHCGTLAQDLVLIP